MPPQHLGYYKLWQQDDKWQVAQFFRVLPGPEEQGLPGPDELPGQDGTLWVSVHHWYYAVHTSPWENVAEFLTRYISKCAGPNGGQMKIQRGSMPKASLGSVWAITCQLAGSSMKLSTLPPFP